MDISTYYNPFFNTLNIAYKNQDNEEEVVIHKMLDFNSKYYNYPRPLFHVRK
jgi:hypothetical protein